MSCDFRRTPSEGRFRYPNRLDRSLYVVHPHNARTLKDADNEAGNRAGRDVGSRHAKRFCDEVLVGRGDQRRKSDGGNFAQAARNFKGMIGVLVEIMTGVDKNLIAGHTPTHRKLNTAAKEVPDLLHDIVV